MNASDRYSSIVKPTTPRLMFEYEDQGNGAGSMKWGIHGVMPAQLIIAATIRAQAKLCDGNRHVFEACPEKKLVIAWPTLDTENQATTPAHSHHISVWFLHPDVPADPLITMLEVAKSTILASMLMRQQQEQQSQGRVQAYRADGRSLN